MSDVHAIILVPSVEHRAALLRTGPCGSRPPAVALRDSTDGQWRVATDDDMVDWWRWPDGPPRQADWWVRLALPLAWDGVPVPEGCFRANPEGDPWHIAACVELVLDGMHADGALAQLRYALRNRGTVLLLDAVGREVEP